MSNTQPDIGAIPSQILNDNQRKLGAVSPRAIGSNLSLMIAVSIVTIVAFSVLRPRNKAIYEPKVKYHDKDKQPPKMGDGVFSWISPLIHTDEQQLLEKCGLDVVAFLRFLRMLRWMFLGITIASCGILIPVNIITHRNDNTPAKGNNFLATMTVQDIKTNMLFVHVAVTYIITFFALGLVWWNWKAMVRLRHQWFRSAEYQRSFYARTLMITHVPRKFQSDTGIQEIFQSVRAPYPTSAVQIGRHVGDLPELIEFHNQTVRSLEQVLVKYFKGGKIGKKRPTITIGGFMGLGGEKKDAIDYYTAKIRNIEQAIARAREAIHTRRPENYGFASMAAVPYAHVVARLLQNKHPKGTNVVLAPNPKDIIWKNLAQSDLAASKNKVIGWILLGAVCFFYTFPLILISLLANLTSVATFVPFLDDWANNSQWTFSLVSGILPPAISAAFGFFLPRIMRVLSRYQGALTRTRLDRAIVARYFAVLIISQLVIFTIIGVIYNAVALIVLSIGKKSVSEILAGVSKIPNQIQNTWITLSNYWLTFLPLRGFLTIFDLAQIVNLLWVTLKTHLFGRTPRDIREWRQPPIFEYAIYYSNLLFVAAVGLVYAPLAPLVAAGVMIVFWISSVVYKYQLMFVFVTKVESGGRLWNVVINRLLASLIFMHLFIILTLGTARGWLGQFLWIAGVPMPIIVIIFKIWISRTLGQEFRYYVPNENEIVRSHVTHGDTTGRIEKRFGHPALHADLFTPMVHAKCKHLLPEVYRGRIGDDQKALQEYGGHGQNPGVLQHGGLRIAAVEEYDIAYDPTLYQRDRGELDWDTQSVTSVAFLGNGGAGASQVRASTYNQYLTHGPGQYSLGGSEIELSPMNGGGGRNSRQYFHDDGSRVSLLGASQSQQQQHHPSPGPMQRQSSNWTMQSAPPSSFTTPPSYYSQTASPQSIPVTDGIRAAPIHRQYSTDPYGNAGGQPNMAGRGAHNRQTSTGWGQ